MDRLKEFLAIPFKAAGAVVKIAGRVTIGIVGFVLMGAGLLLINPLGIVYAGVPVFVIGLLLLVKAIF